MTQIQALRDAGMHDIMPTQIGDWHYIEAILRQLTAAYGYQEVRVPLSRINGFIHPQRG